MEKNVSPIRTLFLQEFVKHIITNIQPQEAAPAELPTLPEEPLTITQNTMSAEYTPSISQSAQKITPETSDYSISAPKMIVAIRELDAPAVTATAPKNKEQFNALVRDPSIESIECRGPDQPLMVKKNNTLMQTSFTLSDKEIRLTIDDFARYTKTQLTEGILRAETPSWHIIAIVSEFGGSRFLIQKTPQLTR